MFAIGRTNEHKTAPSSASCGHDSILFKRIKTRTIFQSYVHKNSSHLPPDNITAYSRSGQVAARVCSGDNDTSERNTAFETPTLLPQIPRIMIANLKYTSNDNASTMVVIKGLAMTAGSNPIFFAPKGNKQPTSMATTTDATKVRHTVRDT